MRWPLFIVALLLTACSPIVQQTRADVEILLSQGKLDEAEQLLGKTMDGVVTANEYAALRDTRCDTRMQIAAARLKALQNDNAVTFDALDELHTYVRRCANFQDVDLEITNVGVAFAEKTFVDEVEPLWAANQPYEALSLAREGAKHLPQEHERATWIEQRRDELAAKYRAGHASAANFPLTAATFARLHNNTLPARRLDDPIEELAAAQLRVHRTAGVEAAVAGTCANVGRIGVQPGTPNTGSRPYTVLAATVHDCESTVRIGAGVEEYEVPVQKTVIVKQRVETERPVHTKHSTAYRTCYTSSQGFGTGCRTDSVHTRTITTYEKVVEYIDVEKVVTEFERRERPIKIAYLTARAQVAVEVAGFDGTRRGVDTVTVTTEQRFPAETSDASIQQGAAPPWANLGQQSQARLSELADDAAKALRSAEITRQVHTAFAEGDLETARELALVNWASYGTIDERSLFDHFGAPANVAAVTPTTLPSLEPLTWLATTIVADVFKQDPLDSFFEGIVVRGYPWNLVSAGVGYRATERGLAAQPDRSAVELVLSSELRWSLMTSKYHRGVGALFGLDLGAFLGKRLGEDYEPVVERPFYVTQTSELGMSFGFRAGVPAMLGFRTTYFAAFAGVRPTYTNFSVGHFFSEGGTLPLAGRLELRFQERFPLILEGWTGVLSASRPQTVVSAVVPIKTSTGGSGGLWLRGRFDRLTLPARIPGLHEADDVYVPEATATSMFISLGTAF